MLCAGLADFQHRSGRIEQLTADLNALSGPTPPTTSWPVRLLGRFDPLILAHADKACWIDDAHYKRVRKFVLAMVRNESTADDVTQETFLRVSREAIKRFRAEFDFEGEPRVYEYQVDETGLVLEVE